MSSSGVVTVNSPQAARNAELTIAFVIYLAAAVIAALLALAGGTVGALLGSLVEIVAAFLLQATLVKAKAQAEANKLLQQSLTALLIQNKAIERWNARSRSSPAAGRSPFST